MKKSLFPVLLIVLIAACSSAPRTISVSSSMTPDQLVRTYFRDVEWRLPEPEYMYMTSIYDRVAFVQAHRDEMLKTLEVVETKESANIGVAFIRYSVGTKMYRKGIWMRKVDGNWRVCQSQYFSTYGDDPFKDGKPDDAKKLIERVDEWEKGANEWF